MGILSRTHKLVGTSFFLQKLAGSPLKSVSSISPIPRDDFQPPCTSLDCSPCFPSYATCPISMVFPFLAISQLFTPMIPLRRVGSDLVSTSKHQSWSSDNLPVLFFSYFSCSFGLAIFTCVFEFDISFLSLKACRRNTSSVGQVQYLPKLLNDYYKELSSEPPVVPVK